MSEEKIGVRVVKGSFECHECGHDRTIAIEQYREVVVARDKFSSANVTNAQTIGLYCEKCKWVMSGTIDRT